MGYVKNNASYKYTAGYIISLLSLMLVLAGCGTQTDSNNGSKGPSFDSGRISPDETFSFKFENTGTVEYYCEIHKPDMQGKVHVKEGASKSGKVTVEMRNTQFQPNEITIAPGTTVEWVNKDSFAHTVKSGNPDTDGGDGGGGGGYY